MRFDRIVVGTDFSAASVPAVEAAKDIARKFASRELTVVHVYELPAVLAPGGGVPLAPMMEAEVQQNLRSALEDVRRTHFADLPSVHVELLVGSDTATKLCRFAERNRADLLVVGTHGRTGFSRILLGSVAKRVVRYSPCAVLTVRTDVAGS